MRTIKFRAWDKKENMMRNVISLHFLEGEDGVVVWGKSYTDHDTGERSADRNFLSMDDIELLQFTGLLDKNGKEIYEGDIVKETNESGTFKYKIDWDEFDCCLYPKALYKTSLEMRMSSNYTEFEVIGNIYESADLLAK